MNERARRQGTRLVLLITFGALLIGLASLVASHVHQRHLNASLIAAIRDENTAAVKSLLEQGASANSLDGDTVENARLQAGAAAGASAKSGNDDRAHSAWWDFGSQPDPQQCEATALMRAVQGGDATIVQMLLEHGAGIQARNALGETALMWAARSGHDTAFQQLLDAGADLRAASHNGDTALGNAAATGNRQALNLLLDRGVPDTPAGKTGKTALMWMVQRDDLPIVQRLLDTRPGDVNQRDKRGKTALMFAADYNPVEGIRGQILPTPPDRKTLLKEPADSALHVKMVSLLLDRGADINAPDNKGITPLMVAAAAQWPDGVQTLLRRGASVQARDNAGRTALLYAFDIRPGVNYWQRPDHAVDPTDRIVSQLLDKGADIRARDVTGQTALSMAFQHGRTYLLSYLLDRGADVSGENGVKALLFAAGTGNADLIRRLLDRGVDINGRDSQGRTPLLAAVMFGGQDVVSLLLAHGADVNAKDKDGKTALMVASVPGPEGRPKLVPLLKQAGARE